MRWIAAALLIGLLVPAVASGETTKRARLGKAITLGGFQGDRIQVRAQRVAEVQGGEFDEPAAGKHYVGVWISLKNVGRGAWSDSPSNGAKLVSNSGRVFDTTIIDGECDSSWAAGLKIPRGQTRRGCLPFEVADGARLRYFEFTLASGFADETGQWSGLGGRHAALKLMPSSDK